MRRAIGITTRWLWGLTLLLAWAARPALAQSCEWASGFQMNNTVRALTVFDDGTGPALYAGGSFTRAGGVVVNNIARWDGREWSPLGSGTNSTVSALTVFNDGTGPALYAGGSFTRAGGVAVNNIAKWNGTQWSPLGRLGPAVSALTVFDDGTGPALYAGGQYAPRIAKWNGTQWSELGGGISGGFPSVSALTVFDDGTGAALYAGGVFTKAGGVVVNHIAKWNGRQWSALGSGMDAMYVAVLALTVFDDGTGLALYAGGSFTTAGGVAAPGSPSGTAPNGPPSAAE